jgi:hypothetical protein
LDEIAKPVAKVVKKHCKYSELDRDKRREYNKFMVLICGV